MLRRSLMFLGLLLLLFPLLAACGDDDDDDTGGGGQVVATATAEEGDGEAAATATSGDEGGEATEAATTGESDGEETAAATSGAGGETATSTTSGETEDRGVTVTIGSKNFTEQLILGEMYAQLLEDRGFTVERSLNLGSTAIAHEALVNGDIDMYPEYTGTGLLAILNMPTQSDSEAVYNTVKEAYQEQWNLVWLDQAPMNNTQALAVKREFSEERGITTISQMVAIADELVLAAVPDFEEREDGLVGLNAVYGDFEFKEIKVFEPAIKYQAFLDGEADVVLAFGTDGQIAGHDLVVLEDDKGLWPPYHVAPVIRQEKLDEDPEIADILNEVAPLLEDDVMQDLNWRVDGPDAQEPADVAHDFLVENGLIQDNGE